jgi:hypothetical protein
VPIAPAPKTPPTTFLSAPLWLRQQFTCFGIACVCLGLLLWARLILVTGHPRQAIATPGQAALAGKPQQPGPAAQPDGAPQAHKQPQDEATPAHAAADPGQ